MSDVLLQSAIGAESPRISVAIASGLATVGTGMGTLFDVLPALLGSFASVVGILVTCWIGYHTVKKIKLERRQLNLQNNMLVEKAAERKKRRLEGEPTRRDGY